MSKRLVFLVSLTALLGACDTSLPLQPDYTIKLMPAPNGKGMVAVPAGCPSWDEPIGGASSNQHWPRFGCSTAHNLAAQIERPEDLIDGRPAGAADAITTSTAVARYQAGKTTPLIDAKSEAPTPMAVSQPVLMGGAPSK